jgi:hypothetical protein
VRRSGWHCIESLRRLASGYRLEGPEVGGFTSGCLRMLAEVFGFGSGGISEVVYGANCGEFFVVANFWRRFCGVFCLPAPDIRKSLNYY